MENRDILLLVVTLVVAPALVLTGATIVWGLNGFGVFLMLVGLSIFAALIDK